MTGSDPAFLADLRKCVHCGICLPQCPTYLTLGEEMDSPRGRIYLMRAAAEGRVGLTDTVVRHLDLCLGCRACETACPSGVPFGRLLEATRARIAATRPRRADMLGRLLLGVFPRPDRVGRLLRARALYERSGLQRLVRAYRLLDAFPRLRALDALAPTPQDAMPLPEFIPAAAGTSEPTEQAHADAATAYEDAAGGRGSAGMARGRAGAARGRVGLLTGCVQRQVYPHVNRDTAWLLSRAGWDVVAPADQGCCGALDLHAGRVEAFRSHARALARSFGPDVDFIVVNAAGCGSAMKEYDHWLDEPGPRRVAVVTRDVSEVLADAALPLGRLDVTVTYHDACHLAHGQRIRNEPRALLARIPGLHLVELPESDLCCGSAGVYNLLHPEIADQLLARKVDRIIETGARIVATGNPGCLMQIARGCRERGVAVEVVHPVELLARSAAAAAEGKTG